jgi:rhodanese-related sulfurtransferase
MFDKTEMCIMLMVDETRMAAIGGRSIAEAQRSEAGTLSRQRTMDSIVAAPITAKTAERQAPPGPASEAEAEAQVAEADVHTVRGWLAAGDALLVDVREAEEFEEERIPGALMAPMSLFDPARFPRIPGMKLVLVCASGRRSRAAALQLLREGHARPINMTGGFYAWKEAGLPTAL